MSVTVRAKTPLFNSCYAQIRELIKGKPVTAVTIVDIVTKTMCVVQKAVKEKKAGEYKKELVMSLVLQIIEDVEFPDEATRGTVRDVLEMMGPSVIDGMVYATQGAIGKSQGCKCTIL
jgi:hypothetical protein